MYYVIGLNHLIQYTNKRIEQNLFSEFEAFVGQVLVSNGIEGIVEEFNEDCLLLNNVEKSVLQMISEKKAIKHRFVDPTLHTRILLGIGNPISSEEILESYRRREAYWLKEAQSVNSESLLVCIGASHVEHFAMLLETQGIHYQIVTPYWQKEAFDHHK